VLVSDSELFPSHALQAEQHGRPACACPIPAWLPPHPNERQSPPPRSSDNPVKASATQPLREVVAWLPRWHVSVAQERPATGNTRRTALSIKSNRIAVKRESDLSGFNRPVTPLPAIRPANGQFCLATHVDFDAIFSNQESRSEFNFGSSVPRFSPDSTSTAQWMKSSAIRINRCPRQTASTSPLST
jgi:hypothetical protein